MSYEDILKRKQLIYGKTHAAEQFAKEEYHGQEDKQCKQIIDIAGSNQCGKGIGGIGKVYVVLDKEYLEIKQLLQDIIKWEKSNFIEADLLERIKCLEDRMKL